MTIDQSKKHRFCGYCGKHMYSYYDDFDTHLNYCELVKANEAGKKRKDDKNSSNEKS
jgi:hypothetical protein